MGLVTYSPMTAMRPKCHFFSTKWGKAVIPQCAGSL